MSINQHNKYKYDHYVNPHAIRAMINMIANHMREHKNNGRYKHG